MRGRPGPRTGLIRPTSLSASVACSANRRNERALGETGRADAIGSYWANPKTRTFAELLIDSEEDGTLRPVLIGMLPEVDCRGDR
jgi:hypothetical protein